MVNFCECSTDGHCSRYNREMRGRMRELCAGVNTDLGTAAAFREQWRREAKVEVPTSPSQHLILKTGQAPGDAVAMTAAIYSLHKAHPGKYTTSVESYWPDVFLHNPDVKDHSLPGEESTGTPIEMHYPAIHRSNERGIHFMQGWCEFLSEALGVAIPLATNRPQLYFDRSPPPVEDWWLICAGGKKDFTNKQWGSYQRVVELLEGKVKFLQVGGCQPIVRWREDIRKTQEDYHPRLEGTIDMIGKTSLRELFYLARKAKGILCGVSLLMHVAAALEKPAVIIAGGREPVQWNAYPKQHYLHTVGSLSCCEEACWTARTVPLGDGSPLDLSLCERPIGAIPECMERITPEEVAATVSRTR